MSELESNLQGNSLLYDEVKASTEKLAERVKKCADARHVENEIYDLRQQNYDLQEQVLEARCRAMKHNLIFSGIAEKEGEDCEETVKNFLEKEMKVEGAEEMTFVNVHRIGKKKDPKRPNGKARSIVAKFSYNKEITKVKQNTRNLKGTNFIVYEQYPEEIERRRKKLYPIAKAERKKKSKVALVRDKLYVNDELVDPVTYKYTEPPLDTGGTPIGPRAPPRMNKRARVGSTPDKDRIP